MENNRTLSQSLSLDLARLGMTQADLARRLSEGGDPITEPGISNWVSRSRIPRHRERQLLSILGDHGATGEWLDLEFGRKWSAPKSPALTEEKMTAFRAAVADVVDRRQLEAFETDVRAALPPALRPHLNRNSEEVLMMGQFKYRVDYLSPLVVVDLKAIAGGVLPASIYRTLFQLAAVKAATKDARTYGVLVLDSDFVAGASKLSAEAGLLGVHFEVVDTAEKAAKIIQRWEAASEEEEIYS